MTAACGEFVERKTKEYIESFFGNLETKVKRLDTMAKIKKEMDAKGINIVREQARSTKTKANINFLDWNKVRVSEKLNELFSDTCPGDVNKFELEEKLTAMW